METFCFLVATLRSICEFLGGFGRWVLRCFDLSNLALGVGAFVPELLFYLGLFFSSGDGVLRIYFFFLVSFSAVVAVIDDFLFNYVLSCFLCF